MSYWIKRAQLLLALFALLVVTACGGGDGFLPVTEPTITAQPADTQVTAGSAVRFSVTVDGADVTYQWQRSTDSGTTWVAIAGATSASYSLAAPTVADSGSRFRVLLLRGGLQTISSAVTLTVSALAIAPAITVQPQPAQVTAGGSASFSVTATGTTVTYRWQTSSDGSTWADAAAGTTATLTLPAVALSSNQLQVRVVVANSLASITSNPVRLTVLEQPVAPTFTQQPTAATVVAPGTATFTVAASGTPAPTLQWQRSTDGGATYSNIAGATASSFTTAATSLADSGTRYRVVASNATASVNSNAAVLTVTPALVAPAVTIEPVDATVAAGASVTFSAMANGNPQPVLQWQISTDGGLSFANINGATAASYTVSVAASDNGRRYRVVATNSQGSITSRAALLTVTVGVMVGRDWVTAQSLEDNNAAASVLDRSSTIDDAGRVTVIFRKNNGSRDALYAVRGIPNGPGQAPTWTTPVLIDLQGTTPVSNMTAAVELSVTAAPGGDVVALWNHFAACTATTYGTAPFQCRYYYLARYRVATNAWDAPALVTDTPDGAFTTFVNDKGDTVLLGNSWVPFGTLRATAVRAVFLKTAAETTFRRQLLSNEPTTAFVKLQMDMDGEGNLLLATQFVLNGVPKIVAYRGTASAGLGSPFRLDTLAAGADLLNTRVGLNGQQVVVWWHLDGAATLNKFAATSPDASTGFTITDLGDAASMSFLSVTDTGTALLCTGGCRLRQTWTPAGGWSARTGSSGPLFNTFGDGLRATAVSRNGDMLYVETDGLTATYDSRLHAVVISGSEQHAVLGLLSGSVFFNKPLLSISGIGFVDALNSYDVLPTPAAPAGVVRTGPTCGGGTTTNCNLWGAFLK